jgi:hypothetical protein
MTGRVNIREVDGRIIVTPNLKAASTPSVSFAGDSGKINKGTTLHLKEFQLLGQPSLARTRTGSSWADEVEIEGEGGAPCKWPFHVLDIHSTWKHWASLLRLFNSPTLRAWNSCRTATAHQFRRSTPAAKFCTLTNGAGTFSELWHSQTRPRASHTPSLQSVYWEPAL